MYNSSNARKDTSLDTQHEFREYFTAAMRVRSNNITPKICKRQNK